jgi:hypothetical protein
MKLAEAEDLSIKEFAVEDDESSVDESELKLGREDSRKETNRHRRQDAVDC